MFAVAPLAVVAAATDCTAAEKIVMGASVVTQQDPFYVLLADAVKKEAEKYGVSLQLSVANQDLNKQLSDVEDFITKGVNAIVISPVDAKGVKGAMYSFTIKLCTFSNLLPFS